MCISKTILLVIPALVLTLAMPLTRPTTFPSLQGLHVQHNRTSPIPTSSIDSINPGFDLQKCFPSKKTDPRCGGTSGLIPLIRVQVHQNPEPETFESLWKRGNTRGLDLQKCLAGKADDPSCKGFGPIIHIVGETVATMAMNCYDSHTAKCVRLHVAAEMRLEKDGESDLARFFSPDYKIGDAQMRDMTLKEKAWLEGCERANGGRHGPEGKLDGCMEAWKGW
jgi:hypothetical protein